MEIEYRRILLFTVNNFTAHSYDMEESIVLIHVLPLNKTFVLHLMIVISSIILNDKMFHRQEIIKRLVENIDKIIGQYL